MSRYNLDYPTQQLQPLANTAAENAGSFHATSATSRHDERGLQADSEDGSGYKHYPEIPINDSDVDEDPNASLTSQTLNADGTPKRPMNAFMIFARRRRPQVSAENQSMRTGEISKILSREWNSMSLSDKQFYLDQAKLLKENFNSKYPDYVYRRRPNNSRKKRRTDTSGNRAVDSAGPADAGDDLSGGAELDASSAEGEEVLMDPSTDAQYSRMPSEPAATYDDTSSFAPSSSRTSPYVYSQSSEMTYRQHGGNEHRPTYDRNPLDTSSLASPRVTQSSTSYQPYVPGHQSHTQSPTVYSTEQSNVWDNPGGVSRSDHGRATAPSGWSAGNPDRPLSSMSELRSPSYPAPTAGHAWTNTNSPGALASPGSPASQSPNYAFPTLNSPFYPNQPQMQGGYSSTVPPTTSSPNYSPNPSQAQGGSLPGRSGTVYDHRGGYAPSPSISPISAYTPHSARDQQMFQHQTRPAGMSRALPPVQSISNYSQSQSMQSPSPSSSGPPPSHLGYWNRDKMEGQ